MGLGKLCDAKPRRLVAVMQKLADPWARRRAVHLWMICLTIGSAFLWTSVGQAQQISSQWSRPVDITLPSDSPWSLLGLLLCDQYQNVHVLWADHLADGATISYRNDVSGNWSVPTDVLVVSAPDVIVGLNAVIANNTDTIHVVWRDVWTAGSLYYSQVSLLDASNPRAWSRPWIMANDVIDAKLQVDPAGTIHLVYAVSEGDALQQMIFHIKSTDNGNTWSEPVVVVSLMSPLPSKTVVNTAIDDAGRIHVGVALRSQDYGTYSEVGYVRSTDGGQTWSAYKLVDKMGSTFQGVEKIAPYAFGKDEVHLTWHNPTRLHQWSLDGGETWSQPIEIMTLGAAFGGENQLVKDSAGNLYVVTAEANGVYSAKWDGTRWGLPERIDDRPIDPHGQNMIVCQGNQLHVVYYDRTGDNTVWYSSRRVDAPAIGRRPLPVSTPQPTPVAAAPLLPISTGPSVALPGETNFVPSDFPKTAPSSFVRIGMLVVPVVLLIVCVIVLRRLMGHQHESGR